MADRRKLAQGLMMMTPAMREDLASREQDIQRGKTVELLRRAGKEMYENPIVNTAIGFTPGVGDVQAAGETFAALQRGAPWQETAGYAVGMLPFVPALRTTWHGSPHGFTKFDLSKIGTGEGAQAYGHGLYLAESPEVASGYKESLSGVSDKVLNASFSKDPELWAAGQIYSKIPDADIIEGLAVLGYKGNPQKLVDSAKNRLKQELSSQGYLYKVDLPDEQIAKMLDWDKPLSEQPESVRNALQGIETELPEIADFNLRTWMDADPLASTWHNTVVRDLNVPQEELAQKMYQRGIPGLQYFDSGSRGGGEGTRNYVVFSDEIPQILERNNIPVNK